MDTKHQIVKKDYYRECGDGCCTEYGHEWYVDSQFIYSGPCEDSGWLAILEYLGFKTELIGQNENGEDTWSL